MKSYGYKSILEICTEKEYNYSRDWLRITNIKYGF